MTAKESTNLTIKQKLKTYLSKGDIKKVADEHGCTIYNVNKVINGRVNNPVILNALLEKAEFAKGVEQRAKEL